MKNEPIIFRATKARTRLRQSRALSTIATVAVLALGFTGCVGRRQALLTTQKLKLTSEQAVGAVSQARTNEGLAIQAHRDVRQAYRQLAEKTWQTLLEAQTRSLEVEYQKAVSNLEAERGRLLEEQQKARHQNHEALDNKLNELLAEAEQKEAAAEKEALEARKKAKEAPGDLPLLQKSLEKDVVYFAFAAKARDIELRARMRAQSEMDKAETSFQERLQSATKAHREKLLTVLTGAKEKLAAQPMPALDLGPEPEGNAAFYESVVQYLSSVKQAGSSLESYLESNWFGGGSFLAEYLRSTGGGLVSGFFKPAASVKEAFASLRDSAKGLGSDLLGEIKGAGTEATKELSKEAKEIGTNVANDFLKNLTSLASDAIRGGNK